MYNSSRGVILANILYDLGNVVVGYDDSVDYKFTEEGLRKRGIKIYSDNTHLLDKDMVVTYSVALSPNHKEILRAKENGLIIKKYNEILGDLTSQFNTICVSGTHGKTTTTTMISHILDEIYKVNYFIGDGTGFADKDNKIFVIESDEFNRHFLSYNPEYTVITNIEEEHMEIYKDIEDIRNTFEEFANKTKKVIVACGDNKNVKMLKLNPKVFYYGFNEDNDIYAKNVILNDSGSEFDLVYNQDFIGHFVLPLFGRHMVLDALAAIAICHLEGVSFEKINDLLKNFKNAKRRFAIENIKDNVLIDDYAHHPTEIKVTLEAARQKYPEKELIAVFKPNTYSRTRDFYKEFAESLNIADKVYLTEIDCNREKPSDYDNVTSKIILDLLKNGEMISEDNITNLLKHKNAVICFMSCASVEHLEEKYKKNYE